MGRWHLDDARSPGGGGWTPSPYVYDRPITREPDPPEIRSLPDCVTCRDRDHEADVRHHHLTLPSELDREEVRDGHRAYRLRGSEVDLLESAGRFRSVFVEHLRAATDDSSRCDADQRSLERPGLIESKTITRVRHSETADVITVTPAGRALLERHRDPDHDEQKYYGGWVKPSEVIFVKPGAQGREGWRRRCVDRYWGEGEWNIGESRWTVCLKAFSFKDWFAADGHS